MIDPNWQLTDLDPVTWRNLGRFIEPANYIRAAQAGERGLFVLHDNGRVLRVVDEANSGFDARVLGRIEQPAQLAGELHAEGNWDRVHIINKQHLASVARAAQSIQNRALSLDQYYLQVSQLIWGKDDGYVSVPPKPHGWNGFTYDDILKRVHQLPERASVVLGVLDQGAVHIGLVLEFTHAKITRVTTFEALKLPSSGVQLSQDGLEMLWRAVSQACYPAAAALLCDLRAFDDWIKATDKPASLQAASTAGRAFWKM